MASLSGKYKLEKNENFIEFLTSLGQEIKPEFVEKLNNPNSVTEVKVNGDNVTLISTSSSGTPRETNFTIGKDFEEEAIPGVKISTTPSRDGDKIVLKSNLGPKSGTRTYEATPSGLIITFASPTVVAKRHYTRV